jgi:hypothetical protein
MDSCESALDRIDGSPAGYPVLPDMQFAHDGVSDHADVAFDVMRVGVLIRAMAPPQGPFDADWTRPQRGAAAPLPLSTLRACGRRLPLMTVTLLIVVVRRDNRLHATNLGRRVRIRVLA